MLLQFGKSVEVESAIHEEVLALPEGLQVAVASRWISFPSFLFELDFKSVMAWVANPSASSH